MTEQLMPRVETGIFDVVTTELIEGKLPYIEEMLRRIAAENPGVANFISQFSKNSSEYVAISTCGVIVYRLIASQLEADALKKSLSL